MQAVQLISNVNNVKIVRRNVKFVNFYPLCSCPSLTNIPLNELVKDFDHDFEKGQNEDESGDIYLQAL